MCNMQTDIIKIDKYFPKNLGRYFKDVLGSDGSVSSIVAAVDSPKIKDVDWFIQILS